MPDLPGAGQIAGAGHGLRHPCAARRHWDPILSWLATAGSHAAVQRAMLIRRRILPGSILNSLTIDFNLDLIAHRRDARLQQVVVFDAVVLAVEFRPGFETHAGATPRILDRFAQ